MTTEVALFNRTAIALAADSAVSIEGTKTNKIYNNAEKLFALTKFHPVAIMIYGNSSINRIGWELIIKEHRKHLKDRSFLTLREYADSFFNFTRELYSKVPKNVKDDGIYDHIEIVIENTAQSLLEAIDGIDFPMGVLQSELKDIIISFTEQYDETLEFFDGFDDSSTQTVKELISPSAIKIFDIYFDSLLTETEISNISDDFVNLCTIKLIKQDPFFKESTGIVIAGYGENELFPELLEYETHGFINDNLKLIEKPIFSHVSNYKPEAGLKAFAQKDEIETFMLGVCLPIRRHYNETMSNLYSYFVESIIDFVDSSDNPIDQKELLKAQYIEKLSLKMHELEEETQSYIKVNQTDKVVNMLKHLPKNELAYMAESLVNLTAFKRKVSHDADSVGGPIDVMVISKGDGLVWIKRKHYFPFDLNKNYKAS